MDSKGEEISPERAAFFAKFSHGVHEALHYKVIDYLRHRGVAYVVAPYESDAQLGFMYAQGVITMVLTEDSDLFVYGVRRMMKSLKSTGECKVMDLCLRKPSNPVLKDLLSLSGVTSQRQPDPGVCAFGVRLPRQRQRNRHQKGSGSFQGRAAQKTDG